LHARVRQISEDGRMMQRVVGAVVLLGSAACGGGGTGVDAALDVMRSPLCEREGTSSVTGAGPAGSLDGTHAYAVAFSGFCPYEVDLVLTVEDRLATPYLDGSVVIVALIPDESLGGGASWSGTFPATIARPGSETGEVAAHGTLQVDAATPGYPAPTRIRATARFGDGPWQLTATIDAPYCIYNVCL
jgi:hypothetical protein